MTQDLSRTRIMVRVNALFYNWWSLFVRMIDPESRREARTSRPQMMERVVVPGQVLDRRKTMS